MFYLCLVGISHVPRCLSLVHLQEKSGSVFSAPLNRQLRGAVRPPLSLLLCLRNTQPLFVNHVLQPFVTILVSLLLQCVTVSFALVSPKLDGLFQVWFHKHWVEGNNHFWLNSY